VITIYHDLSRLITLITLITTITFYHEINQ